MFKPETLLSRNNTLSGTTIDDDLVMMDATNGSCFGLNTVAKTVWELLETPKTYQAVLTKLLEHYDVDLAQCEKDMGPFLEHMVSHKLIYIQPE